MVFRNENIPCVSTTGVEYYNECSTSHRNWEYSISAIYLSIYICIYIYVCVWEGCSLVMRLLKNVE